MAELEWLRQCLLDNPIKIFLFSSPEKNDIGTHEIRAPVSYFCKHVVPQSQASLMTTKVLLHIILSFPNHAI